MVDHESLRRWLNDTKSRGMALGLANTNRALQHLSLPPCEFETIHIAGSNGKGTLVATLCAALSCCQIPNLAFTSPHLVRVEERIRLNGIPVQTDLFDEALVAIFKICELHQLVLTYFEITYLAAMYIAHHSAINVLILETGLGGRLDATRTARADVSVLTALSLEHTDILGDTLLAIAKEKAAIARPNRPLIARWCEDGAVREVIEQTALQAGIDELNESRKAAQLYWVEMTDNMTAEQEGRRLAHQTWQYLQTTKQLSFPNFSSIQWPARMQLLQSPNRHDCHYLIDGAHNPSGMEKSCAELLARQEIRSPWLLLVGCTPQRDVAAMFTPLFQLCREFPPVATVITVPQGGRYLGVDEHVLADLFRQANLPPDTVFGRPSDAVAWIEDSGLNFNTVISIGSLYMQGNVLEALGLVSDEVLSIQAKI